MTYNEETGKFEIDYVTPENMPILCEYIASHCVVSVTRKALKAAMHKACFDAGVKTGIKRKVVEEETPASKPKK